MDDRLEAQLQYLRSDERIIERARMLRELAPAERLRMAYELSRSAARLVARQPEDVRLRLDAARERPPADAQAGLLRLGRGGW